MEQVRRVAQPVTTRLSWTEIFAVLSLGKATAARAVREEDTVDAVAALLDTPVRQDQVFGLVTAINPTTAMMSPQTALKLVSDDDYYRKTISRYGLWDSARAVSAIDQADGDGYWSRYESAECDPNRRPELFAAHLIYRMYVYLYLADLLGCPYSADALRTPLIPAQLRRGFAERVTILAGEAQATRDQQVNELLGFEAFKIPIPLVLKYVLSRASKPSEVLEIALETRDSKPAQRFRKYGARVDAAVAVGNREDVVRACAELSAYGVRLEAELPSARAAQEQALGAAKELVSVASPLLGAVIPGLALAAGQASTRIRRRKFAFLEQVIRAPRTLNEVEREFAQLWPRLLPAAILRGHVDAFSVSS